MEKLIIVKTLKQLKELEDYLEDKDLMAFDTETTGLEKGSSIIGFSVAAEVDVGYYVILSGWNAKENRLETYPTLGAAKAVIEKLKSKSLIMHNMVFDCRMVHDNFGVQLKDSVHTDTLALGHLLNENRYNGLKERGVELYGEDAREEQILMRQSVYRNGGVLTKKCYELYKADADLIARYGAKDAILTLKVFYNDVPILFEQGLDRFFYEEETMPLLRGPTYDLNTTGLKVDPDRLQKLKGELEADCIEAKAFITREIDPHIKDKYPGTSKRTTFNINACQQRSWLLFVKLQNHFNTLTKSGKEVCKSFGLRLPYALKDKRTFITMCQERKGTIWEDGKINPKTKKMGKPKKVGDYWTYFSCGKKTMQKLAPKYKWCDRFLQYTKDTKMLSTYVLGIQDRMKYGIIRPEFNQQGTTSGRYSSKNPNFQNLPREDKRIKHCIIARPGKVFVGADHSQLEPRCFVAASGDKNLQGCFIRGDDFYSVTGAPVFEKTGLSMKKSDKNSFATLFPKERQDSKIFSLAIPYGMVAAHLASDLGCEMDRAQEIIDKYFESWPMVHQMQLDIHEEAKTKGIVYSLFGRPRRIPKALKIPKIYGDTDHADLPYEAKTLLNLAVNHRIQSTAASINNRGSIAFYRFCKEMEADDSAWADVKLVLQVHDSLVAEAPEHLADQVAILLKEAMENTVELPGVKLEAIPSIGLSLSEMK